MALWGPSGPTPYIWRTGLRVGGRRTPTATRPQDPLLRTRGTSGDPVRPRTKSKTREDHTRRGRRPTSLFREGHVGQRPQDPSPRGRRCTPTRTSSTLLRGEDPGSPHRPQGPHFRRRVRTHRFPTQLNLWAHLRRDLSPRYNRNLGKVEPRTTPGILFHGLQFRARNPPGPPETHGVVGVPRQVSKACPSESRRTEVGSLETTSGTQSPCSPRVRSFPGLPPTPGDRRLNRPGVRWHERRVKSHRERDTD